MQIIGFNFEKIQAERKNQTKGKIEINSNINIKNITQEKVEILKDKPVLKFEFEFSVNYKPNMAEIKLQGFILAIVEKDQAKNIVKKWKEKKLTDEIRVPVFNLILTKSNLKALQLEEELGLPTHVPLPKIRQEQTQNANYTG